MSPRTLLRAAAPLLAVAAIVPAAPAAADQAIAEMGLQAPVAGYGGWSAWSTYDQSTSRYALTLRNPSGTVQTAPIGPSSKPWDVSLGPDADNNVVAVYRACGSSGCNIRRLNVTTGGVQTLNAVSSPTYSEATPAIWKSTVAFTRRINGCDVPYAKNLSSSTPSVRLLKSKCLQTAAGQVSIRGTRVIISSIDLSQADANGAGEKTAELRRYSSTGGSSAVMLRQTFGEETNVFGQVAQDGSYAYTVRYGVNPTNTFVRIPFSSGTPQEIDAFRTLTGAFAQPTTGGSLYVEEQSPGAPTACDGFTLVPCRVVLSSGSAFNGANRTLTPQLTVGYLGTPTAGQPLTFTGVLSQQVVLADQVVSTTPVAGVTVTLYHRNSGDPETFTSTGLTAVTAANGSYTIVLPAVGADPFYTAVASTPGVNTWAGRGTVGSVAP